MSILLDLLGSFVIAGLLLMAVVSTNAHFSQFTMQSRMDLAAQENVVELANIIQHDFRKIGYHMTNPQQAIMPSLMDSTRIGFYADIDNDHDIDSVVYALEDPGQLGTQNPNDRRLYRSVGTQVISGSLGLTDFKLRYYDYNGQPTTLPQAVRSIDVTVQVESPFQLDSTYSHTTWKGRIYPLNLQ